MSPVSCRPLQYTTRVLPGCNCSPPHASSRFAAGSRTPRRRIRVTACTSVPRDPPPTVTTTRTGATSSVGGFATNAPATTTSALLVASMITALSMCSWARLVARTAGPASSSGGWAERRLLRLLALARRYRSGPVGLPSSRRAARSPSRAISPCPARARPRSSRLRRAAPRRRRPSGARRRIPCSKRSGPFW
jgi:hypothetical protein